jgi:hypothetical protein
VSGDEAFGGSALPSGDGVGDLAASGGREKLDEHLGQDFDSFFIQRSGRAGFRLRRRSSR